MGDITWALVQPASTDQLTTFYFFWVTAYAATNILWDIRTDRTPGFHVSDLGGKVGVLFNAATFASSLLVLLSVFDADVRKIAGDAVVPLLIAGFSGVFVALGEICPYKPDKSLRETVALGLRRDGDPER